MLGECFSAETSVFICVHLWFLFFLCLSTAGFKLNRFWAPLKGLRTGKKGILGSQQRLLGVKKGFFDCPQALRGSQKGFFDLQQSVLGVKNPFFRHFTPKIRFLLLKVVSPGGSPRLKNNPENRI